MADDVFANPNVQLEEITREAAELLGEQTAQGLRAFVSLAVEQVLKSFTNELDARWHQLHRIGPPKDTDNGREVSQRLRSMVAILHPKDLGTELTRRLGPSPFLSTYEPGWDALEIVPRYGVLAGRYRMPPTAVAGVWNAAAAPGDWLYPALKRYAERFATAVKGAAGSKTSSALVTGAKIAASLAVGRAGSVLVREMSTGNRRKKLAVLFEEAQAAISELNGQLRRDLVDVKARLELAGMVATAGALVRLARDLEPTGRALVQADFANQSFAFSIAESATPEYLEWVKAQLALANERVGERAWGNVVAISESSIAHLVKDPAMWGATSDGQTTDLSKFVNMRARAFCELGADLVSKGKIDEAAVLYHQLVSGSPYVWSEASVASAAEVTRSVMLFAESCGGQDEVIRRLAGPLSLCERSFDWFEIRGIPIELPLEDVWAFTACARVYQSAGGPSDAINWTLGWQADQSVEAVLREHERQGLLLADGAAQQSRTSAYAEVLQQPARTQRKKRRKKAVSLVAAAVAIIGLSAYVYHTRVTVEAARLEHNAGIAAEVAGLTDGLNSASEPCAVDAGVLDSVQAMSRRGLTPHPDLDAEVQRNSRAFHEVRMRCGESRYRSIVADVGAAYSLDLDADRVEALTELRDRTRADEQGSPALENVGRASTMPTLQAIVDLEQELLAAERTSAMSFADYVKVSALDAGLVDLAVPLARRSELAEDCMEFGYREGSRMYRRRRYPDARRLLLDVLTCARGNPDPSALSQRRRAQIDRMIARAGRRAR